MNIMIVEDDRALCEGIALALKSEEDSFVQCHSVSEANESWKHREADLVRLDVHPPTGSGYDFRKEVRQVSAAPVLLPTASDQEEVRVKVVSLGAVEYVAQT